MEDWVAGWGESQRLIQTMRKTEILLIWVFVIGPAPPPQSDGNNTARANMFPGWQRARYSGREGSL